MDFEPNETEQLIQASARDFAERTIAPVAAEIDRESRFPFDVLEQLAELGLMGVNIPASLGGAEAGVVSYVLAMMEIAGACASTAVTMAVTNMVGEVITQFGTDEQRERYVTKITSGEYSCAGFALSEPAAGSDAAGMTTQAVRDGDEWVLNGEKMWITSGAHAGVMVVWARTDTASDRRGPKGITAFLVEKDAPGMTVGKHEDKMGLRGSNTVPLTFEDCRLPPSALLGQLDQGFKVAMMALDGGRIGIGAQSCGIATAALAEAVQYAKDRKAFRKPIASYQAIQWMIADSRTDLDAARLLVLRAARLKEQGKPFSQEAAMAKVFASEAANRICDRNLQIHGGYGYVKDFPAERHVRDVRVTRIYEGTSEVQRMVIGRAALR